MLFFLLSAKCGYESATRNTSNSFECATFLYRFVTWYGIDPRSRTKECDGTDFCAIFIENYVPNFHQLCIAVCFFLSFSIVLYSFQPSATAYGTTPLNGKHMKIANERNEIKLCVFVSPCPANMSDRLCSILFAYFNLVV